MKKAWWFIIGTLAAWVLGVFFQGRSAGQAQRAGLEKGQADGKVLVDYEKKKSLPRADRVAAVLADIASRRKPGSS